MENKNKEIMSVDESSFDAELADAPAPIGFQSKSKDKSRPPSSKLHKIIKEMADFVPELADAPAPSGFQSKSEDNSGPPSLKLRKIIKEMMDFKAELTQTLEDYSITNDDDEQMQSFLDHDYLVQYFNTASKEELMHLEAIGLKEAEAIVELREKAVLPLTVDDVNKITGVSYYQF